MNDLPARYSAEWYALEKLIQERLLDAFERAMRGPVIRPDALVVHPSASQEDIDAAILEYRRP